MQPTIEQAAALAWDLVKADADPPFSHCLLDHQQKLIYHAQDVQRGGPVSDDFERKVKDVLANPEQAIAEIKAKLGLPQMLEAPAPAMETPEPLPDAPPTKPLAKPAKAKKKEK
jgi:hypothetical protein